MDNDTLKKPGALSLLEIQRALNAQLLVGEDKLHHLFRACTGSDLMSDILNGHTHGVVLLTGLNNIQAVRTSVIAGVAAVVLVRGKQPTREMIDQARQHGLPLLCTPLTMFSSCGILFCEGLRGIDRNAPIRLQPAG